MNSRAFKKFKKKMGQTNHFLITIMVGLDAVAAGAQKRDDFHVSWSPKDINNSVDRSKLYAKKASLSWAVDCVDMYFTECNRVPRLFKCGESSQIDGTGHSVYNKLGVIIDNHSEMTPDLYSYVDLLICWRNNMVHFDAHNSLKPESENYFQQWIDREADEEQTHQLCLDASASAFDDCKGDISKDHFIKTRYHLNFTQMIGRFNDGKAPSLKELTTLISMTIHFIEKLDAILVSEIDQYAYLEMVLYNYLKEEKFQHVSIFSRRNSTPQSRQRSIKSLLITLGVAASFFDYADGAKFLNDVSLMTQNQFVDIASEHNLLANNMKKSDD